MRKKFQYNYNDKKYIVVEFDIVNGTAKNITFSGNFQHYYPVNPEIEYNEDRKEYGFRTGNMWSSNGDMVQIINRILKFVAENN